MVDPTARSAGRSVYGLHITGLDDVAELDTPSYGMDPDLIPVEVRQSTEIPPAASTVNGDGGVLELLNGHTLHLQRSQGRATYYGAPLSTDELAHPYLGPTAVVFNRWSGREVFHAAGFVAGGRVWFVMGPRTAGKSTLTAALAAAAVPILADDLVVTDGDVAYSGPRSVDLREALPADVLAHWRPAQNRPPMTKSRMGTRLRVVLPAIESRWPLGGWIFLRWGDRTSLESITLSSLLGRLAARRCGPTLPSDPARLLALASLPAFDLYRPRHWNDLPETVHVLLETVCSTANLSEAVR